MVNQRIKIQRRLPRLSTHHRYPGEEFTFSDQYNAFTDGDTDRELVLKTNSGGAIDLGHLDDVGLIELNYKELDSKVSLIIPQSHTKAA